VTTAGRSLLPRAPIDRFLDPLTRFLHVEAAGGIVLLLCTAVALGLANSPFGGAYLHFWETEVGITLGDHALRFSLEHWINDGLMVLFFFVVGLEVKRELVLGELREARRAALPIVAAIGGMAVPAAVYLLLAGGGPAARGWGIPMATDIAFVVGCMALLGHRVPHGLRIMLLTLAIADDIGAILVIAIGYASGIHGGALLVGVVGIVAIVALQRLGVRSIGVYTLVGVGVWLAFLHSGVHATIAGVIIGLLTPARPLLTPADAAPVLTDAAHTLRTGALDEARDRTDRVHAWTRAARESVSPLEYLERLLHPWVGFVVMPIFALANAGVVFRPSDIASPVGIAVAAVLFVGKPIGVLLASWVAVRVGLARLPDGVGWGGVLGGGTLAGIGFTMALFIAGLSLPLATRDPAKVGILVASALAAIAGMTLLAVVLPKGTGRLR
jgi:NhaA family Na+:H+ antiporter